MTNLKTLGEELLAIGRLIGLVTKVDGNIGVNTAWFGQPTIELGSANKRLGALVEFTRVSFGADRQGSPTGLSKSRVASDSRFGES